MNTRARAAARVADAGPFAHALAVWHMDGPEASGSAPVPLTSRGTPPIELGRAFEKPGPVASVGRGGDGMAAVFPPAPEAGPGEPAWLSVDAALVEPLRPRTSEASLYVRVRLDEAGGSGTLFFSDWMGLAVTVDGLAIAFLGVTTSGGATYREFPLAVVERGDWLDIVLRVGSRRIDLVVGGDVRASVPIAGDLVSPFESEVLIGAFPGQPNMPENRANVLVAALVDTVAVWDAALTDSQIAELTGRQPSDPVSRDTAGSRAIEAYNEFATASDRKDVDRCRELGRTMRDVLHQDRTRPIFHLTAPAGRMFDPSGAFWFEGRYHVFSYHDLYAAPLIAFNSQDHYTSTDLVHWEDWPLGPVADTPLDVYGMWLANLVVDDDGVPNAFYGGWRRDGAGNEHGVRAISRDGMVSFGEKKVVFPEYHDGHVWKEGDTWYAITMRHSSFKSFTDPAILIHTSPDLDTWTERGVLFSLPAEYTFSEYPYLVSLGGRDVLMAGVFPEHGDRYWVGTFDREAFRFIPDDPAGLRLDHAGAGVFNPSFVDDRGPGGSPRRVIIGMEPRPHGSVEGVPWSGLLTTPRVLSLEDGHLRQDPVPELEALRGAHHSQRDIPIPGDSSVRVEKTGDALEIVADFESHGARTFGLEVRVSDDGATCVRVLYDAERDEFGVEGNIRPVRWGSPELRSGRGPAYQGSASPVRLRVILDKIFVEAFVNGQACTTSLEDADPAHAGIELFSEGGDAVCTRLDIWEMRRSV